MDVLSYSANPDRLLTHFVTYILQFGHNIPQFGDELIEMFSQADELGVAFHTNTLG